MITLQACVYEKVIYITFDQLETDSSENIDIFSGSLWAAHGAVDLLVTNKEL